MRILYLGLLKAPLNVHNFARNSLNRTQHPNATAPVEPGAVITKVVQLLRRPVQDLTLTFLADTAAAFPNNSKDATSSEEARAVMRTQFAGVLLSIVLQLSLADDNDLKRQLHDAGAEQLLCKLALQD